MTLCVDERPVEVFGIMRRLPWVIKLMAGNLDVYELLEPVHDELIVAFFSSVAQELKITNDQFFFGCAAPAQLRPSQRVIGFVQGPDGIWTHSRRNGRFEADAPGRAHVARDKGDIVLAPVFKPVLPSIIPLLFRTKTTMYF